MLLDKYDFYDIYAVITAIRHKPDTGYNTDIIKCIYNILTTPQENNIIMPNIIRNELSQIKGIDKELFNWVYVQNVYTFGHKIEKDEFYYRFLGKSFAMLLQLSENNNIQQLADLTDALHNIPIYITDMEKSFKKQSCTDFSYYNKKYGCCLWNLYAN